MTNTPAQVIHGDCIEVMASLPAASVDSIVTDPPYGLGFMGKKWDALPPGEDWARECLRVLKPGGHLLAFGGTRTWHRLAVAVEDAGFEIRDSIAWMHGQGFPKGKAGLKPAHEPIVLARKKPAAPRTGLLQIDACRVATGDNLGRPASDAGDRGSLMVHIGSHGKASRADSMFRFTPETQTHPAGRWPANVILDEEMAEALDEQSGNCRSAGMYTKGAIGVGAKAGVASIPIDGLTSATYADSGGASRFFYVAKAGKRERPVVDGVAHTTVKPLTLMRHLVRLVTPEGGTVLEPFAGSGATVEAALIEGFNVIGIEREAEYLPLIQARIERAAS